MLKFIPIVIYLMSCLIPAFFVNIKAGLIRDRQLLLEITTRIEAEIMIKKPQNMRFFYLIERIFSYVIIIASPSVDNIIVTNKQITAT